MATENRSYYIAAQLVGATVAALFLKAVFPAAAAAAVNPGTPAVGTGIGMLAARLEPASAC